MAEGARNIGIANTLAPGINLVTSQPNLVHPRVLQSWKEIAVYLSRGVRTLQRWHRDLQLPVHKIRNTDRSPVFAFAIELDDWMRLRAKQDTPFLPKVSRCTKDGLQTSAQKLRNSSAKTLSLVEQHREHVAEFSIWFGACKPSGIGAVRASRCPDPVILHPRSMPRPTVLVAEPEPSQALSVRKLVLETAKFNVLTAHSTREALDIFHLFPNISAAVLVGETVIDCDAVAGQIKGMLESKVPVVFLTSRIGGLCRNADYNLDAGEPEKLLETIRSFLGDPRTIDNPAPKCDQR